MIKFEKANLIILFCLISFFSYSQEDYNQFDAQGKRHGKWKGVHEASKRLRYEGTFEHGVEKGMFTYYSDDKKSYVMATRDFSNRKDGCYVVFYDSKKNKVSEGLMINKKPEGEWKYYHFESDKIMTLENYSKGVLEGVKKIFYKNGNIAEESTYKNGKLEGVYKKYAENDTILEELNYKSGFLDGSAIYYDGKGKIQLKGQYKKDRKWGYWEIYEEGKLVKKEKISKETRKTFKLEKQKDGSLKPSKLKEKNK